MTRQGQHFHIRPGYPDFLDLPWHSPLENWDQECQRLVHVEQGLSRHVVRFVEYHGKIFAIKALPDPKLAQHEYRMLRQLKEKGLPAVAPVGYVTLAGADPLRQQSVIISEFLELALPYRSLFVQPGMQRYQPRLLKAMACLLVRLHLAGFFWGDCSLSNVLFKRDAGELGAFVVDVETSVIHPSLQPHQREADLEIMYENVLGDLWDLRAEKPNLTTISDPEHIVSQIRAEYEALWQEINREILIQREEHYKIHERVEALNQMGFSVDEIELLDAEVQGKLKMRTLVTDQNYHRHHLHNLTGIVANDNASRLLLNAIREHRAWMHQGFNRSVPLSVAAYNWLSETYWPTINRIKTTRQNLQDEPECFCQVLENKWYLSEKVGRDVGLEAALEDFVQKTPGDGSENGATEGDGGGEK